MFSSIHFAYYSDWNSTTTLVGKQYGRCICLQDRERIIAQYYYCILSWHKWCICHVHTHKMTPTKDYAKYSLCLKIAVVIVRVVTYMLELMPFLHGSHDCVIYNLLIIVWYISNKSADIVYRLFEETRNGRLETCLEYEKFGFYL